MQQSGVTSDITMGLMNHDGKYLTAEKFGNQINVKGSSLRSKQMWIFETSISGSHGYLKSPQLNYLETSKTGDVLCNSDKINTDYLFEVIVNDDGKWLFKDRFGKFLSSNSRGLFTQPKVTGDALWGMHIASHPQCNVLSPTRKRYVHTNEDQLCANEDIPWGHDAVVTVEFHGGKYVLRDFNGRYLNAVTGCLDDEFTQDALLIISLHGRMFGFQGNNGKYLTVHGPLGKLISTKSIIGKDEQFLFEKSKAQCVLIAANGKKLSIKQGIDVTANQFYDAEDTETFQLGYYKEEKDKVTFLAKTKKFWHVNDKSITATADIISENSVLSLEWKDEKISLKAYNGKYLSSTSSGQISPTSENSNESNALFTFQLVNRTRIVLRGENGYVGITSSVNKIQCNRGIHDAMQVVNVDGKYRLKTSTCKWWKIDSNSFLIVDGEEENEGDLFLFKIYSQNKMLICAPTGKFLQGDNNGSIKASGDKINAQTLWEY